jgi:semaphorin 6
MEDVFAHRWLVHRTLLLSVLGYLLCCVSQFAMASGLLEDPKPKFVTSESYFTKLRTFQGESLTAMSLSQNSSQLYLGGKNVFYIIDLARPLDQREAVRNFSWVSDTRDVDGCTMKGKQNWQCQNFIQVVLVNNATGRLLVCGTNAWSPACRNYEANSLTEFQQSSGTNRCPYSPAQKSTAIFAGTCTCMRRKDPWLIYKIGFESSKFPTDNRDQNSPVLLWSSLVIFFYLSKAL